MQRFDYERADSVDAAVAALKGGDAAVIAGGQTLLPAMKHRLAATDRLVDIARLADLKGIALDGDVLRIGAAETHAEVAASQTVRDAIPALAALAAGIGDPAVRHRGTIGGSVANNDPSADYPAAMLALGATIETTGGPIPADAFFTGMFETALGEGEIVTALSVPRPLRAAYVKHRHPASRYALAGVFVAQTRDGIRVAVTGAGADGVFRASGIEAALSTDVDPGAIPDDAVPTDGLIGDMHAAPDYRAALVVAMARRAVATMIAD